MPVDLILGTAGHVDHGKTSLIRALTGVDTDRLPEEKRRGITIDLGFAQLVLGETRLAIVDVPGHERFVRNMLAGATGMDLALLIVAADEGVKQQTREHLDILRMVDVRGGVIVISKADLVTDDWLELVEADVRELVAGSALEGAAMVRTSTVTGRGLDQLRQELAEAAHRICSARAAEAAPAGKLFRLAIDRTFSVPGHGTVVTGTVASGSTRVGDELVIEPGEIAVRVRGLQHHERPVTEVHRGQRAAVNLAGVHHDAIRRGQELAALGYLATSKLLTAWITLLPDAPQLRNRARVRVHLGTAEVMASAAFLDRTVLEPGGSAPIQLFLAEGVVATWNQPLVIRSQSPARTIGGGRVLEPNAAKLRRPVEETLRQLQVLRTSSSLDRAAATLYLAGWRGWHPDQLPRLAGVPADDSLVAALASRGLLNEIHVSPLRTLRVHQHALDQAAGQIAEFLGKLHARSPLKLTFPVTNVYSAFAWLGEHAAIDAVLKRLEATGRIRFSPRGVGLKGRGPELTRAQQTLWNDLIDWFRAAGINSPGLAECQARAGANRAALPQLLALAVEAGELVQVAPDYWLHVNVQRQSRRAVQSAFGQAGFTVSQLREVLATTRKYAVPLCEYWDRVGFTVRSGDMRTVRPDAVNS